MVEHHVRNVGVGGSTPLRSTIRKKTSRPMIQGFGVFSFLRHRPCEACRGRACVFPREAQVLHAARNGHISISRQRALSTFTRVLCRIFRKDASLANPLTSDARSVMLRIPLPEDDGFALALPRRGRGTEGTKGFGLQSFCVSLMSLKSLMSLISPRLLAPRGRQRTGEGERSVPPNPCTNDE